MEEILLVNPRRRKRRLRRGKSRARRSNPHRHRARSRRGGFRIRRRRLRNPRMGLPSLRSIQGEVVPAVIGAGGALALDIGMAYLGNYLPAVLQSGWGRTLAQLGGALGLGFLAARVVGRRNAQIGTLGALTVIAYNAIRPLAADALGDKVKGLSGLADFGDYTPTMGAYMQNGRLGAYMQPAAALLPGTSTAMGRRQMGAYMGGGYSEDMFG